MEKLFSRKKVLLVWATLVCMVLSSMQFSLFVSATIMPEDNIFYGDDFENPTYTSTVWETTPTVASPPAIVNGALSFSNASGGTYTHSVKDSYLAPNKVMGTLNFEMTATAAPNMVIYLYYNKVNSAYAGLYLVSGGGHLQIQWKGDTSKLTMTPSSGSYIMNLNYAPYGNVIKVTVVYTYNVDPSTSAVTSIAMNTTLKFVKSGETSETTANQTATITPLAGQAALTENSKFALAGSYHAPVNFDNFQLSYLTPPDVEANAFKAAHSRVLALSTSTVESADAADINSAIDAYNSLSTAAKNFATAQKTLLDSLIAVLSYPDNKFTGDSFSSANLTNAVWQSTGTNVIPPSVTGGVLSYANASGFMTTTIKDAYWPQDSMKKLSFEMTPTAAPDTNVYLYYNPENTSYVALKIYVTAGHTYIYLDSSTAKLTVTPSSGFLMNSYYAPYGNPIKITATYTYNIDPDTSAVNSISVTATAKFYRPSPNDAAETTTSFTTTITPLAGQAALISNPRFAIKNQSVNDPIYFDNFAVTFAGSADDIANQFRTTYSRVLGLTALSVKDSDTSDVNSALAAFDSLSVGVKALLTSEKALLDTLSNALILSFGDYKIESGNIITNVNPQTTVTQFQNVLLPNGMVSVFTNAESQLITDSAIVGTGTTVQITHAGEVSTYTIVIYGDVTGDGLISSYDLIAIKNHLLGKPVLTGYMELAGDIYGNGSISVDELLALKDASLNLTPINQSR